MWYSLISTLGRLIEYSMALDLLENNSVAPSPFRYATVDLPRVGIRLSHTDYCSLSKELIIYLNYSVLPIKLTFLYSVKFNIFLVRWTHFWVADLKIIFVSTSPCISRFMFLNFRLNLLLNKLRLLMNLVVDLIKKNRVIVTVVL